MNLHEKYKNVIALTQQMNMQDLRVDERDGKLHVTGTVRTVPEKNKFWDALKGISGHETEVAADIRVSEAGMAAWETMQAGTAGQAGGGTYTVKAGDTLSKIAKEHLGDANAYMEIFNANRDQLKDPDKIFPGQVLKIPQHARK